MVERALCSNCECRPGRSRDLADRSAKVRGMGGTLTATPFAPALTSAQPSLLACFFEVSDVTYCVANKQRHTIYKTAKLRGTHMALGRKGGQGCVVAAPAARNDPQNFLLGKQPQTKWQAIKKNDRLLHERERTLAQCSFRRRSARGLAAAAPPGPPATFRSQST